MEEVVDQIQITDNQSRSTEASTSTSSSDPVALMNSQMEQFNNYNPYPSSSGSKRSLINSASSKINRLNVLDELKSFDRPDSSTGSDDSNSTIKEYIRPKAIIRALNIIGNNNNR